MSNSILNHQGTKGTKGITPGKNLDLFKKPNEVRFVFHKVRFFAQLSALGALVVNLVPCLADACPRCVDATPYKTGMQLAVAFLLPIPFLLAGGLFFWIRKFSKPDSEQP
jgi:hypothetical protein